ncbi:cytochrome P450 734A1 [Citrus sinensis]|uniref:Cytochrome P450 734A1 n=1 Tax=Citrus sinensis TaxID=2711 RepID=A0ACB8LG91_CITSI|nr:cytochrome P450 734A1 [Citrus sinensis]
MGSQGIRGPAYRLVYGNTKEILSLRNQIWISPMGLSHDILPRILPHICSWTKQYGMNFLTWYGSRAQLVITQPELIKEILSNSDGTYPKVQAPGFLRKILGYDPSDGCKCGDYVKKMETQRGQGDRGLFRILVLWLSCQLKVYERSGIRDSIIKMMKTREEKALKGESEGYGNDYFGLLLKAYHDPDMTKRISLDVLIDECKTFYIAGHETTTKLLTWTILLLATHTDWQEKLREEVLELFGQKNPAPDGIGKLKTMSMVINESLRLYPPAVNISRNVEREVRLGKYILPANMELVIPILAIHHDPQIWGEDVDLFKPERFADGVAKASNNTPAAFLPFSSGPRICVGLNFAATEAKIALSMILQRYRFNLSPSYVHSPVLVVTLRPQHGLQVIFQPLSVNQRN